MSQVKVVYGEAFDGYIPIYCRLGFPIIKFAENLNEVTEVKSNIN